MNKKRCNIDLDTRCPVCKRFDEDGGHCFLKCKGARQCWRELNLEDTRGKLLIKESSREFVGEILNLKPDHCAEFFLLLWKWWICE
jgi:hypothetical protein